MLVKHLWLPYQHVPFICSFVHAQVAFLCNHCPYVVHIRDEFIKLAREYMTKVLPQPSSLASCQQLGMLLLGMPQNQASRQPVPSDTSAGCSALKTVHDTTRRLCAEESTPPLWVPGAGDVGAAWPSLRYKAWFHTSTGTPCV